MHWFDIAILVVLGIGAAMGFWTGLLWQIARVVSFGLSLYFAVITNTLVSEWIGSQWPDLHEAVNRILAFISVFLAVFVTFYILTRIVHKIIKDSKLETYDRMLGALLGIVKASALVACICGVMAAMELQSFRQLFEQTEIAPYFAKSGDLAATWFPQSARDRVDEGVQQIRDELEKKIQEATLEALKAEVNKKK